MFSSFFKGFKKQFLTICRSGGSVRKLRSASTPPDLSLTRLCFLKPLKKPLRFAALRQCRKIVTCFITCFSPCICGLFSVI